MKNPKPKTYKLKASQGFTLVELLISMTLFVIIVGLATGSFIRALRSQQAIVNLISTNDNASLTLEQMAREIRTSTNLSASSDSLRMQTANGEIVTYKLQDKRVSRQVASGAFVPLTASNVNVERLSFYLLTRDLNDRPIQPRVTIFMRVVSPNRDVQNIFTDLQTTVSPRVLN